MSSGSYCGVHVIVTLVRAGLIGILISNSEVGVRDTALNNVGQAFQPAGSPDFPVRPGATGKSPQLADKNVCPTQAACCIAGQLRNSGQSRASAPSLQSR